MSKYGLPLPVFDAWRAYLHSCIRCDLVSKGVCHHIVNAIPTFRRQGIASDMQKLGLSNIADTVFECLNSRQEDVRQSIINSLGQVSQGYLEDFDWRMHVSLMACYPPYLVLRPPFPVTSVQYLIGQLLYLIFVLNGQKATLSHVNTSKLSLPVTS